MKNYEVQKYFIIVNEIIFSSKNQILIIKLIEISRMEMEETFRSLTVTLGSANVGGVLLLLG